MEYKTLEEVVRLHVNIGRKNSKGWEECLHTSCDHGRKGNRAAFLFENGQTAFHCFNCGTKTVYDPETHEQMPSKMVGVLRDFNIPDDEWKSVLFTSMAARNEGSQANTQQKQKVIIEPPEIQLPRHFYRLKDADPDDKWANSKTLLGK